MAYTAARDATRPARCISMPACSANTSPPRKAAGQLAPAVREWLRAAVQTIEDRGVLDPRPGRTADELCGEAGLRLPVLAADLRAATATFDEVWYGGRTATADDEAQLRAVDKRLAGSHRNLVTA